MRSFEILISDDSVADIPIGYTGENNVTQVFFDCGDWKKKFGSGTVTLLHQRNGDTAPYPITLVQSGDVYVWLVSDTDLAKKGVGECQLRYSVSGKVAESRVYSTHVLRDLGTGSTPPSPWETWLSQILEAAEEAEGYADDAADSATAASASANLASEYAEDAEDYKDAASASATSASTSATNASASATSASTYATNASNSADSASGYATNASNSATSASNSASAAALAVTHYPKIDDTNHHWLVWNSTTSAWTDTGILAEGVDGEDGEDGVGIVSVTKTATVGLVDTYTITFTNGTTTTYNVTNGSSGSAGRGISSISKTSTSGLVDTYTITYSDGTTSTYTISNGAKGDTGEKGDTGSKGDTGNSGVAISETQPTDPDVNVWINPTSSSSGIEISDVNGLQTALNGKSAVSGTNDGTNWTALTVDGTTKNIPQGGGAIYRHCTTIRFPLGSRTETANYTFYSSSQTPISTAIEVTNTFPNRFYVPSVGLTSTSVVIAIGGTNGTIIYLLANGSSDAMSNPTITDTVMQI